MAKIEWHGVKLHQPDWSDSSHSIALTARIVKDALLFHIIFNAYWEPLEFELPPLDGKANWRRWIDTSLDSPDDIIEFDQAPQIQNLTCQVAAHTTIVLLAPMA